MASISPTSRPGYVYDSATDTWIPIGIGPHTHQATDLSGVVDDALIDAKGDLIVGSAADTPARLAVGNNGDTLVADSSATTGLRWQGDYAAGKNKIINGDFGIWQRGTSFTANGSTTYTADRTAHYYDGNGAVTVSRQTFTPGTAPVAGYEGQYFYRYAQTTNGTGQNYAAFYYQPVEDVRTLAGQTVTFSFWAKSDASRTYAVYVNQWFGSGGSSEVANTTNITTTTSWVRYSYTTTLASLSGKTIGTNSFLSIRIEPTARNTAQTLDLWGVQLEAGSTATAFQTATGTLAGELAACQRYYEKSYELTTAPGTATETGMSILQLPSAATGNIRFSTPFKVTKRTSPTISLYDGAGNINKVMYDFTNNKTGFAVPSQTNVDVYSDNTTNKFEMGFQWTASAEL